MKLILICLVAGLAGLTTAPAKDISYYDLTLILDANVTVETNAESGWLSVSWGRPDSYWSTARWFDGMEQRDGGAQFSGQADGMAYPGKRCCGIVRRRQDGAEPRSR